MTDSAFTGNSAADGGGIDVNSLNGVQLTAAGDSFTGNSATAAGGAIYNQCIAAVTGTTFDWDTAGSGGGAFEPESGCFSITSTVLSLSLTRSRVLGSFAAVGGGGIDNAGGTVSLTGSQVLGNSPGSAAAESAPGPARSR